MERKYYTDNFEQLLKEKTDEFRMYPSKRVWHSIYNNLHPGRKWPSFAVSMLLVISLLTAGYWNSNYSISSDTATIASSTTSKVNAVNSIVLNNAIPQSNILQDVVINHTPLPASVAILNSTAFLPDKKNTRKSLNTNSSVSNTENIFNTNPLKNKTNYTSVIIANPAENKKIQQNDDNSLQRTTKLKNYDLVNKETNFIIPADKISENSISFLANPDNIKSNNVAVINSPDNILVSNLKDNKSVKFSSSDTKNTLSVMDKAWIENYAFYNKSKRKKWQDRTALELYITPNIGYRKLTNDTKYNIPGSTNSFAASTTGGDANKSVNHKPGLGLEAGIGITYSIAKNLRLKAGLQANYTNYGVNADETNHPILTTLMLLDPVSGYPFMHSGSSTLSNSSGLQPVKVHNKTYQVSIPVGFALKLSGTNKLEWYAGATIQPSFVLGGKANLISADRKNYIADASLIRKWNLNAGFETYFNYKLSGFTLQVGPQFRYQILSTYSKKYTVKENLYNVGLKVGILKNF